LYLIDEALMNDGTAEAGQNPNTNDPSRMKDVMM
jgi:hypothetical protein